MPKAKKQHIVKMPASSKPRKSNTRIYRALHDVFAAHQYKMDGNVKEIRREVRARGINILALMGKDIETVLEEVESEYLRKLMRDHQEPIGGVVQRAFVCDGAHWLHLPGRMWLQTRQPDVPDAYFRRREGREDIAAIIRYKRPLWLGHGANIMALKTVYHKLKSGEVFEQPSLILDEKA